MNQPELLLDVRSVSKKFYQGVRELAVLKGVSLQVRKGDAICIMGSSGAGKSTLLQIMGTLDKPTEGDVIFEGQSLLSLSDEKVSEFRNKKLGFVFQFHHLLSEFTALENVMLPCQIAGTSDVEAEESAQKILSLLGLQGRFHHYPSELSGGEQQRVAIARALVMKPALVLADEPTGNLDSENAIKIQEVLFELREKLNLTIIVVSHDADFARKFPKVLHLKDGQWMS
jgi:lipoprotein-releasing system ATP-binding protein